MSLDGKRVVVTRAEGQAGGLAALLAEAGGHVILCPTIQIVPPPSWAEVDAALARLGEYRWVVFTSSNGVRSVVARMRELGLSIVEPTAGRVAAVGGRTAEVLLDHGVGTDFVPATEHSAALAETLPEVEGARILLARSDIAHRGLADALRRRGAEEVEEMVAYRTELCPPSGEALGELRRGVDCVTFTSPSTVRGFCELGEEGRTLLRGVAVVTLGPAATAASHRAGLEVAVEARERTMEGLFEAVKLAFER